MGELREVMTAHSRRVFRTPSVTRRTLTLTTDSLSRLSLSNRTARPL